MKQYYAAVFSVRVFTEDPYLDGESANIVIPFDAFYDDAVMEEYTRQAVYCTGGDWEEMNFQFDLQRPLTLEEFKAL